MEPIKIPDPNLPLFKKRVESLNKRASAKGAPPLRLKELGTEDEVVDGRFMRFHIFELSSEGPLIPDWTLVGVLEHKKGLGTLLRGVPGQAIPRKYRDSEPTCDHCNMKRKRRDTYVVRFKDTSTHAQVGSSCLQEFLGDEHTAKQLQAYGALLRHAYTTFPSYSVFSGEWLYDTRTYLGWVVLAIRNHGWISKAKAEESHQVPTCEVALDLMRPRPSSTGLREFPASPDFDTVDKALEWGKSQDNGMHNDYLHNLALICKCPGLEHRDLGIAASLLPAYQRTLTKRVEQPTEIQGFFGVVGERETFDLVVERITHHDGQYGTSHLHRFKDGDGNVAIWWSSKKVLKEGESYSLKCTVKEHAEYRGRAQTVLTRCAEANA